MPLFLKIKGREEGAFPNIKLLFTYSGLKCGLQEIRPLKSQNVVFFGIMVFADVKDLEMRSCRFKVGPKDND